MSEHGEAVGGVAELIAPALRWNASAERYDCEGGTLDEALDVGVGAFCFFGGRADAARELIAELTARTRVPLLIAADLERGAGQQFAGATGLPPLAALASLDDLDVMRRAARLTAREARAIGVNWDFAPVVDLDIEPNNPIVGTRSFGSDPTRVGELAAAWVESCQGEGVLACAKHFPGHGRTVRDSHATLPEVATARDDLLNTDIVPFRAAIKANVASVMSAHVSFPALDPDGTPATLSRRILVNLLRRELGYEGLVVTDALIMEGARVADGEAGGALRALNAGCDMLLYPVSFVPLARALEDAVADGRIAAERVRQAIGRRRQWCEWTGTSPQNAVDLADVEWARDVARDVVHVVKGRRTATSRTIELTVIDDDIGGPYPPPSREPLRNALREAGFEIHQDGAGASREVPLIVALFGDIRAWKGRPGYSESARSSVKDAVAAARKSKRKVIVLQFSHPRLAAELDAPAIVWAWGGEAVMQRAAAAWLAR
jgi:beta-glucosidase-like glycosyl hydrolase